MSININSPFFRNEKDLVNNFIKTYSNVIFDNFTSITSSTITENNIISVAVNTTNGFMVAIVNNGSSNDLAYSNDGGITWTFYNKDSVNEWKSITYGNGKFVVVGNGSTKYGMYSTSSSPTTSGDWTYLTLTANSWIKIIYEANTFIAISNTTAASRKILISKDGITWTVITPPNNVSSNVFSDISYGNGRFVIITINISGLSNVIYSTDNGLSWNIAEIGSISSDANSAPRICYSPKLKFFIVLNVSDQTKISYSSDGEKWIINNKQYYDSWGEVNQLIWINELEMFVMFGLASSKFIISTSFDGLNWSRKYTDSLYKKFTSLIWNRYYGSLIGISTYVSNSSDISILVTKSLGINHLIENYYYSNHEIPESFNYNVFNYTTSINTNLYIYPILNLNNDFIEYSILPSLPTGLTLNTVNGVISGTLSSILSSTEYTISAKHTISQNTLRTKIRIEFTSQFNSITSFYYNNQQDAEVFINSSNVSFSPYIFGSNPITYSLKSGSILPTGLYLKKDNGHIYGDILSSNSISTYTFIIISDNSTSQLETTFKIIIKDIPVKDFNYNNGKDIIQTVDSSLDILPLSNDGTNIEYSISPDITDDFPDLTFSTSTGGISGTLPSSYTNVLFTITASNSNNSKTTKLRIISNL